MVDRGPVLSPLDIIFFHEGFSPYLPFVVRQAKKSNPRARVHLLGDLGNRIPGLDYHHHVLGSDSPRLTEFRRIYRHLHPGHLRDERRCIERWFLLAKFLEKKGIGEFLFLDSDMVLLTGIDALRDRWAGVEAAGAPLFYSFCYFFRSGLVGEFCEWIMEQYGNPRVLERWAAEFEKNPGSAIHDMALSAKFVSEKGIEMRDLTQPAEGGFVDSGKYGGGFLQGRAEADRVFQPRSGGPASCVHGSERAFLLAVHVQGHNKSHLPGLTGWSGPDLLAFFCRHPRRSLRKLPAYLFHSFRYRRYLQAASLPA